MKNYKVNVNGTEYKVSIELISETEAAAPVAAAPAPAAAPATAPAASAPSGGEKINAPMPGTILSVTPFEHDALLEIEFESVGKKRLMAAYAKLKKL